MVVPVQESKGYGIGFGIPTIAFAVAIAFYVLGAVLNIYVKIPSGGSPLARIYKVLKGNGQHFTECLVVRRC